MRNIFYFLIVIIFSSSFRYSNAENQRQLYNFNHNWKVLVGDEENAIKKDFNDDSWRSVTLPYAWNEEEAFKNDIVDLSTGIAWYRKHFKLPKELIGKKVFIEFEGVRQAAQVYINGQYLGIHENGITAFGYDISKYVYFGKKENIIAVRTDNSWDYKEKATDTHFQWNNKNFNANYGGIPKNVFLHVTGNIYQTLPLYTNLKSTGQYIYATQIDIQRKTAIVNAETEVYNESSDDAQIDYVVKIKDLDGRLAGEFIAENKIIKAGEKLVLKASGEIKDLNFWSWGYGYLYTVQTVLKQDNKIIDVVNTRTGFRKTEFANGLIKLNDRVIMVKGYAQRTSNEWPALGMSVSPWLSDFSNKLMLESNANLIRWMHITPWKQDVESCDRIGLMQAMPAGDAEKDCSGRQWEQRVEVMRDAIIYNRNNPSIIFYESGNENISEEHMQEMKDIRDKYDPYGGRAIGSREMLDSKVAEYGGEMLYINKSDSKPVWAMEYMRDEGLRKYWDDYTYPYHKNGEGPLYKGKDASAYNRNQDSHAKAAVIRWYDYFRERPGTGKRVSSGGVNIIFSDSNTHHRGTENYRRSGEVDAVRVVKDAFYAHKVMWNGWVEVEEHSSHIVGHWNYNKNVMKDVYVISTGDKVELKLNSKSMGYGRKEYGFLFTFDSISWEPGILEAISYDEKGLQVDIQKLQTTGEPDHIKLSLRIPGNGIRSNGADIALVDVEVVDSKGQRCPTSFDTIFFELEGAAQWRGGIAQGHENFILSKKLPVECGVNRVILQSVTEDGNVNLTASAKGLKTSSISFVTTPVEVIDGLATYMPSDGLPVCLDRGPTPEGPSFSVTRKNIKIVNANAGANIDDVELSFDGNQETRWRNNGKLETGWIEYKLEKKEEISEIALKLSGWRTRSYPLVVTANDSVIYMGITSPNLGFYYINPEKPVSTDNVKIRLFGETEFRDTYKLVEITGKLDRETANDIAVKNARSLNIAEIEIFEKIKE